MTIKSMDLNRETAMRLWGKSFGKETKVKDFAGREIAKGAYGDRNSQYGWNVDHVLPQSRGGTTADYNLVCCNIKTNDEKADKFPCFYANGKKFEIIKVQNHYEIKPVAKIASQERQLADELNFYDSASGLRFFKKLKSVQNKNRFVGAVLIRIEGLQNYAVVDFIEELFSEESISYTDFKPRRGWGCLFDSSSEFQILAMNYNMPQKDDISELLNRCVLLNTYFSAYFCPLNYIRNYEIDFAVMNFADKSKMYNSIKNGCEFTVYIKSGLRNTLYINNLVITNTEANKELSTTVNDELQQYNYVYTQLSKNLKKEVEGK